LVSTITLCFTNKHVHLHVLLWHSRTTHVSLWLGHVGPVLLWFVVHDVIWHHVSRHVRTVNSSIWHNVGWESSEPPEQHKEEQRLDCPNHLRRCPGNPHKHLLQVIAYLLKYWCIVSCICVDFVNCFCHRVWSIGGHSVNITFFYQPPDLVVWVIYSITSLIQQALVLGFYSFWFVELWLGYQMFWQELSIGIGFLNTEMCLNNITHPFISSGFHFLWLTQMVLYFTNIDYLKRIRIFIPNFLPLIIDLCIFPSVSIILLRVGQKWQSQMGLGLGTTSLVSVSKYSQVSSDYKSPMALNCRIDPNGSKVDQKWWFQKDQDLGTTWCISFRAGQIWLFHKDQDYSSTCFRLRFSIKIVINGLYIGLELFKVDQR